MSAVKMIYFNKKAKVFNRHFIIIHENMGCCDNIVTVDNGIFAIGANFNF